MIDVVYSDNVTETIKNLRENVYSKKEFKSSFSNHLASAINSKNVSFIPDQLGGWTVNVEMESTKDSSSYIPVITQALIDSIHEISHHNTIHEIACNLANVIVAGQNNIIVKL